MFLLLLELLTNILLVDYVLALAAIATGGTRIEWSGQFIVAFAWLIAVLSVGAILLLLLAAQFWKRSFGFLAALFGSTRNGARSFLIIRRKSKHPRLPRYRNYSPGCLACYS